MSGGPDRTLLQVRSIGLCLTALPIVTALAVPAHAQEANPTPVEATQATDPEIEFSADEVVYENATDVLSAQGQVRMSRIGASLGRGAMQLVGRANTPSRPASRTPTNDATEPGVDTIEPGWAPTGMKLYPGCVGS